jgi:F-type H+-transporting ATPase subunit epsilon
MHLDVVTPTKKVISEEVDEVIVPTAEGQVGILPHHVNMVSQVVPGEMIVKTKGKAQYLAITGGFLEVSNNTVSILSDYAVHAEDIDVEKAIAAKKRAEEMLKKGRENVSERDFVTAQSDVLKAGLQLHVATKRKHSRTPLPQGDSNSV